MARKILLADDSVTAQNMGRKILTDAGYEVVTVNNGSAALKKIAEHKPDLIVLDVYMPGYSGLEVCQRVKEDKETSRIPVLLTVGKLEPFKPEEARRVRADAFVVKPFEASELLSALSKLEDKIVPQPEPYKQGRFAKAAAAFDPEAEGGEKFGDSDGGWKARLRIPGASRKPRDVEPSVDYAATQGKGVRGLEAEETDKKSKTKAAEPAGPFERPIPEGLPHDITPEEIAAITTAAAQLNGGSPAAVVIPEDSAKSATPQASEIPAEESAPVTFASSPSVPAAEPEQAATEAQAGAVEVSPQPETVAIEAAAPEAATADASTSVPAEGGLSAPEAAKAEEMSPAVEATLEPPPTEEAQPQVVAATEAPATELMHPSPVQSSSNEVAAAEPEVPRASESSPPPADDEFMAALQSLMPANGNSAAAADSLKDKDDEMPPALAAIVAEVDSRMLVAHSSGPRWIAEEVALAANEATLSLQKEMEQTYAAFAAGEAFRASAAFPIPDLRGTATAIAEAPSSDPAEAKVTSQVAELPAVLAMAAGAGEIGAAVTAVQPQTDEISVVHTEEKQNRNETINPEVMVVGGGFESPGKYVPAVAESEAPVVAPAVAVTETEIAGGTQEMVANWKNIRDSITGAAAKPALAKEDVREVEPAKSEPEPPPAAVPDPSPPSFGATDPRAIAAIVDSVLAELRPKIVEEIAKKLADPKKD